MKLLMIVAMLMSSAFSQKAQGFKIVPVGMDSSCMTNVQFVQQQLLTQFAHPVDWAVVLACTDASWSKIQDLAPHTLGRTDYAFSDIQKHYSYFRLTKLTTDVDSGRRTRPVFILAHEAAHIISGCAADKRGEALADAIAERLIHRQPFDDLIKP